MKHRAEQFPEPEDTKEYSVAPKHAKSEQTVKLAALEILQTRLRSVGDELVRLEIAATETLFESSTVDHKNGLLINLGEPEHVRFTFNSRVDNSIDDIRGIFVDDYLACLEGITSTKGFVPLGEEGRVLASDTVPLVFWKEEGGEVVKIEGTTPVERPEIMNLKSDLQDIHVQTAMADDLLAILRKFGPIDKADDEPY